MIGEVVGNFRVLSLLGSGGMGDVFLAEHQGIQTRVAIKMLHAQISGDADHVHRFFNEARIVGRIKHAGIVKIFDVGFHAERAYLVMELLEGESLAARIQRGRMAMAEAVDIACQTASILSATHAAGIVHRDLKPDNIYLVPDAELGARARVKVLDFGIAKLSGGLGPRTIGTMGTPAYMAPEQWGDAGSVDWRADIYSLGCVVFEMVAGRPPFAASTITEAFRNHTQAPPPSARAIVPDVPPAFDELVGRMLAKHPPDRAEASHAIAQAFDLLRVSIDPNAQWTSATPAYAISRPATTLGASVGQALAEPPARSRRGLMFGGMFAALVVAVVTTAMVVRGGSSGRSSGGSTAPLAQPVQPASQPPPPRIVETVERVPAPPPIVEPLAKPVAAKPMVEKPAPAKPVVAKPVVVKPVAVKPAAKPPINPAPKPAPAKPVSPSQTPPTRAAHSELEDRT